MVGIVKRFWKPVVFVTLNLFFVSWLGTTLEMLLRVLRGEDPLALLGILVADIVFLVVGILLVILNRYYHFSIAGRALPFIAILTLTPVAFLNMTMASLWFGIVIAMALILSCIVITLRTLILVRNDK